MKIIAIDRRYKFLSEIEFNASDYRVVFDDGGECRLDFLLNWLRKKIEIENCE